LYECCIKLTSSPQQHEQVQQLHLLSLALPVSKVFHLGKIVHHGSNHYIAPL
jgi:hypothetical protein